MKKRGCTLIELLAVIVILGVIMLIAVPFVTGYIERSKKDTLKTSGQMLLDSARLYYSSTEEDITTSVTFEIDNYEQTSSLKLDYKGKIKSGKIYLKDDGEVALCLSDGKYYAKKFFEDLEVTNGEGTCNYQEEGFTISNSFNDMKNQLEGQIADLTEENTNLNTRLNSIITALTEKNAIITSAATTENIVTSIASLSNIKLYNLGNTTTIDVKTFYTGDYTKLTSSNFYVTINGIFARFNSGNQLGGGETSTALVNKNYNATTGILTITGVSISDSYDQTNYGGGANNITTYLII